MNQTLADLLRRHLTAENAHDLDGTLATLHPECRFDDFATGQTWHGREGAAAHYRQWWTTFDVEVQRSAERRSSRTVVITFRDGLMANGRRHRSCGRRKSRLRSPQRWGEDEADAPL
jgi:hypothetical protein